MYRLMHNLYLALLLLAHMGVRNHINKLVCSVPQFNNITASLNLFYNLCTISLGEYFLSKKYYLDFSLLYF